ncbi:type VI secretion protein IcmF/TssM N-terminal domain-containing protein [Celerinatantimonas sp. MCCC 1A17872]|uniref:type VI secretion protein IcmF/TssM N-terminal domain-containing protein n=1 Tax=Celerinatantimonas sp. MCCC 1A17872 TaxID=3177514 RepID=UPI0038C46B75
MKKFLFQLIKALLLILLFVCVSIGCFALVQYKDWPWWIGACLFGALIGLVVGVLFIRKWYLRRHERKFVKRIIEQDNSAIAAIPSEEQQHLQSLQERWMQAIRLLQTSKLKKYGNPLYVLPWYMIFGESDSGKTTAVNSSKLTSILTDVGPIPGISTTRNCDWWFFEEAIILDTAGRYAVALEEGRDSSEWQQFLSLLVRYRKKEPLNGLILTVSVEKLLNEDPDELREYAMALRRKIYELMKSVGAKFPIYILVTKVDLILGVKSLSDLLPESVLSEPLGLIDEKFLAAPDIFVDKTIDFVIERLRAIRLILLEQNGVIDPSILLISSGFERLRSGLKQFTEAMFSSNSYIEDPLLRGIFFSSGKQEGNPVCSLQKLQSFKKLEPSRAESHKGLFLRDLFAKILPSDRSIFTPLKEFLRWQLLIRNLGMSFLFLMLLFIVGLFSVSYIENSRAMEVVFDDLPKHPILGEKVDSNLLVLDQFRQQIDQMSALNHNWWIPRMGINVSLNAEQRFKKFYCVEFEKHILDPLNYSFLDKNKEIPSELENEYMRNLVWYIELSKVRLGDTQAIIPEPPSGKAIAYAIPDFQEDLTPLFINAYKAYLRWSENLSNIKKSETLYQAKLENLVDFKLKQSSYFWLVNWANQNETLSPVMLGDFWGGVSSEQNDNIFVAPAFTKAGYQFLQKFIAGLHSSLSDSKDLDIWSKRFWSWYAKQYYQAWHNFSSKFPQGYHLLHTHYEFRQMAVKMSTLDNPYFLLIKQMKNELEPIEKIAAPQLWVKQVFMFNSVMDDYRQRKSKGVDKASADAQEGVTKVIAKFGGKLGKEAEHQVRANYNLDNYMKVLTTLVPYTDTNDVAFGAASQLLKSIIAGNPSNNSPANSADKALFTLKQLMGIKSEDDVFWKLISGPLDYIVYVTVQESADELQSMWEGEVLSKVTHVPDNKMRDVLFGKTGVVDKFLDGAASPFLERNAQGWTTRSVYGTKFPFTEEFFDFLRDGERGVQQIQPEYTVLISAIPTSVNRGAKVEPYQTSLIVNSPKKTFQLDNFNFPVQQKLNWKKGVYSTTSIDIKFPEFELVKSYSGELGFPKFLKDFNNGSVKFTPDDFPSQKKVLLNLNISTINVRFSIQGGEPVVDLLNIHPISIPNTIVHSW